MDSTVKWLTESLEPVAETTPPLYRLGSPLLDSPGLAVSSLFTEMKPNIVSMPVKLGTRDNRPIITETYL